MKQHLSKNKRHMLSYVAAFALTLFSACQAQSASQHSSPTIAAPPKNWVDAESGHRVIRLSEAAQTQTLPFNQNAFTADGRDMIYVSPKGIYDLNLLTLQSRTLITGNVGEVLVGRKGRSIYYRLRDEGENLDVKKMNIDTKESRVIGKLPVRASLLSVNADETLLAGTAVTDLKAHDFLTYRLEEQDKLYQSDRKVRDMHALHPEIPYNPSPESLIWERAMKDRFDAHIPEEIFTMSVGTGKVLPIMQGLDWLANVQFSPIDPNLLLYAHEGPSTLADRIWTIHADGSSKRLMHTRSDKGESALNEFWSSDGKTIWFDLERPVRKNAFLEGIDVVSGKETLLHLGPQEAALHFNQSPDGSLFVGGGRNNKTEKNATKLTLPFGEECIQILRPTFSGSVAAAQPKDPSSFTTERLVAMSRNNYVKTDPNTRFSPDGKLVIFTSDMFGSRYIFAVEVGKPGTPTGVDN